MSKTILITGAGRGIGRQLALQSLESGASVIACARRIGDLDELVAKGAEAQALEVTDLDAINSLKAALGDRPIDILFNNAGIIGPDRQAIGDMDIDGWRETMEVNVYAPYRVSEALVDNVAASDHRTVVVVSSRMGSIRDGQGTLASLVCAGGDSKTEASMLVCACICKILLSM